ncbi:isochorismatase family protein [Bacteroidota bacterium]
MIKKYVLIIGIICLNLNICISQKSKQYNDKYVIVLDVQQQSYENTQADSSALELTRTVNSLIDKFAPEKVIYVKNTKKILSLSFKGFSVDTMPVPDLDSNLKIVSNNIFTKYSGDAFTSAELNNLLENNSAKNIILVGRLAEECLYQTALGGKHKGYDIYIIPEAIIGKTTRRKEKAIKKMAEKGIKLLPVKEVINTP